ncbi:MAG: hypothetical protein V7724_14060 [Sediminicola sp.]
MRVIVISNTTDRTRISLQLQDLCEGNSLLILNTFEKAENFINDQVVKYQRPLDLIISYNTINRKTANDFRDFIRNDYERTYSKRDFNINTIPLALIVENGLNKNSYNNYDLTVNDIGIDRLNVFSKDFSLTIKN